MSGKARKYALSPSHQSGHKKQTVVRSDKRPLPPARTGLRLWRAQPRIAGVCRFRTKTKAIMIVVTILFLFTQTSHGQDKQLSLTGYLKELFMLYKPEQKPPGTEKNILTINTIHNRMNLHWYPSENFTAVLEVRNRILAGSMIKNFPQYRDMIGMNRDYPDLSFFPARGNGWFIHSVADRAYVEWTQGKWQLTVGRQRINWGVNLIWNPNDVFNSFSYFDFDYEERPGTDAVSLQYYTGLTSSAELVYKAAGDADEMALAGRYRFSRWNYDFQAIGGWVGKDFVAGAGWAGDIRGGGFRGEITHYFPRADDSEKATVASVSGDYTFPGSLYLHAGMLYNSHGKTGRAGGLDPVFSQDLSSKYLSFARYSLFSQISYPVTPLFQAGISAIVNPSDASFYLGPTLTYSLHADLELLLTGQFFSGDNGSEFGDIGQLYFVRLRWSF